ncbi:MAG: diguanylate cyclase [Pseudomonadota bacterium]
MSLFLPKDQPKRLLRLKRFYIGMTSYVLSIGLYTLFTSIEPAMLSGGDFLPVILCAVVTQSYFFWQLRFGNTEYRSDPSLAFQQILVAVTWHTFAIFGAADLRDLFIYGYIMAVMFAMLALSPVLLSVVAGYSLVLYGSVVFIDYKFIPTRFDAVDETRRVLALAGALVWMVGFCGYVSSLRQKLSRRNRDLKKAFNDIQLLSTRDDLTQAFNRRYIMDALRKEVSRCKRGNQTFSIIILDIDHFKHINDEFGHLQGDRVLVEFSERIRMALRSMDLLEPIQRGELARYGGEEFVVLLPHTEAQGALQCAERLRSVVGDRAFADALTVTLSAGVATYNRGEPVETLLQRADQALYEAKESGRNAVRTLEEVALPSVRTGTNTHGKTVSNILVGRFGGASKEPT